MTKDHEASPENLVDQVMMAHLDQLAHVVLVDRTDSQERMGLQEIKDHLDPLVPRVREEYVQNIVLSMAEFSSKTAAAVDFVQLQHAFFLLCLSFQVVSKIRCS